MPSTTSSRKQSPSRRTPPLQPHPPAEFETVDPKWLIKALALTAVAAVICAWLALCLLYYQGSWQLVLRPSSTIENTPASLGLPFEPVRFDAQETGQPRLTGWWVPAGADGRFDADAVLLLHDGKGSLGETVRTIGLLHSSGVNVFAIDYRGFGSSDRSKHPGSETMEEDAAAGLSYLTATRHIAADRIVPYGIGLGGSLAVSLAKAHGEIPALIVDNPDPDPTASAVRAHPSGIVPIRLLYHEHFEIAPALASLPTPKLLISGGPNADSADDAAGMLALYRQTTRPTLSVVLGKNGDDAAYVTAVKRFLDQYLPR